MPNQKRKHSRLSYARGACLAELSITLPLLLIFLFGIADLGQQVGQMPGFSRIAYESVIRGSEVDTDLGPGQMSSVFQSMYGAVLNGTANRMHSGVLDNVENYLNHSGPSPYDTGNRVVSADATGVAQGLFASLPLDFQFNYVASMLTKDPSSAFVIDSNFHNDAHCIYDCAGQCVTSASAQPCTFWSVSARDCNAGNPNCHGI